MEKKRVIYQRRKEVKGDRISLMSSPVGTDCHATISKSLCQHSRSLFLTYRKNGKSGFQVCRKFPDSATYLMLY